MIVDLAAIARCYFGLGNRADRRKLKAYARKLHKQESKPHSWIGSQRPFKPN